MKQKFEDQDVVTIKAFADFKYNNRRSGTKGVVFDVFQGEKSGDYVYEVEFDGSMDLIHQEDLEKCS